MVKVRILAWVSGLPKWLGERRFEMGEGEKRKFLSFFRFHLSPFPQKRLILRLLEYLKLEHFWTELHIFTEFCFGWLPQMAAIKKIVELLPISSIGTNPISRNGYGPDW